MGLKIYTLPRSRGEQVASAHKKPSPHPAERRGFNSGSSDVTPLRRHSDGDGRGWGRGGDPNLNAADAVE